MNITHPTADALDRYRRRAAAPAELLEVDAHLAACDRCYEAVRIDHLTYEQAEAYVDGQHDAAVQEHIATCALCRNEVNDLAKVWSRPPAWSPAAGRRPAAHRMLAAAALVLVFASVAFVVVRREPPAPRPAARKTAAATVALTKPAIIDTLIAHDPTLRGAPPTPSFALHAPVATVVLDDRPTFRWAAVPNARTYELAVADAETGSVVATGSTEATSWRPDVPLPRGRTYTWQVKTGSIVAPGRSEPEARFHVGESIVLTETDHRQRGIALANLGALDDAERELELAGATDLLKQVRGWRQSALPTTTNGAQ